MSMNIFALPGHKVTVTAESLEMGGTSKGIAKKYLEPGEEYTVKYTEVSGYSTKVKIEEWSLLDFNSVNFVDVNPQKKEDDKKHRQWKQYHGGNKIK